MRFLIVLAIALTASPALAQTTTFRDSQGRITGRAEQQGNRLIFRDQQGRITGRAEQTRPNDWTLRDPQGRITDRARGPVPPAPRRH